MGYKKTCEKTDCEVILVKMFANFEDRYCRTCKESVDPHLVMGYNNIVETQSYYDSDPFDLDYWGSDELRRFDALTKEEED